MEIPINFPSDIERLKRSIEADRNLSYLERIQAIDGMLNTIDLFVSTAEKIPSRDRLRQLREEEGHRCIREFVQQYLQRTNAQPLD